jgi:protein TonB
MNTIMNTGAFALRALYQRYITESLMIAGLIHFLIIGGVRLYLSITDTPDEKIVVRIPRNILLNPPPPISREVIPNIAVAAVPSHVSVGTPIPVPEGEINPEATIPTQNEMYQSIVGNEIGDPNGTVYIPEQTTVVEESAPPPFVPVEKQPVPITNPSPKYPELARRAGIEGTVWVKMWVTIEGKVKQAVVITSDAEILNQAALDAALLWAFTPAIMNNGPVAVWVSVPFRFTLNAR